MALRYRINRDGTWDQLESEYYDSQGQTVLPDTKQPDTEQPSDSKVGVPPMPFEKARSTFLATWIVCGWKTWSIEYSNLERQGREVFLMAEPEHVEDDEV